MQAIKAKQIFIFICTFFFLCGFTTTLNDTIIPFLQDKMALSYAKIMLIQLSFYLGYFSLSPLSIYFVNNIKHSKILFFSILGGSLGCFLLVIFTLSNFYFGILSAIYIIGASIASLQVLGNALVIWLGDKKSSASRLTLVQSFTSVGMVIAPIFGAKFILEGANMAACYFLMSFLWLILAFATLFIDIPSKKQEETKYSSEKIVSSTLLWGFFAIFFCVGAEVTIGSFLVKFLQDEKVASLPQVLADEMTSIYWFGLMVGRILGYFVLKKYNSAKVLFTNSLIALCFIFTAAFNFGYLAAGAILVVGLFNSILFPTIFSLSLNENKATSIACSILVMGNIGGAIIPLIQGAIADNIGLHNSFFFPIICYIYILFFALRFIKQKTVLKQKTALAN
ncbi:MFS transporter [Sulfobacillus acidophilus]|uniref:MFS transporter n=1 Tax=Sulfobacillus acidophilus TaxID=53633 RepID=A0ABS3AW76_9FIRM|nr:MFS transporter [Sulfobacillus acidophilus]